MLADNVGRYLTDRVDLERIRRFAEDGDDADLWQGLAELGIPALLVPESAGGVGLACLDAALVAEALGYHAAPAPFLGTAVAAPIALAGLPAGPEFEQPNCGHTPTLHQSRKIKTEAKPDAHPPSG